MPTSRLRTGLAALGVAGTILGVAIAAAPAAAAATSSNSPGWLSGASASDINGFESWLGHDVGVYSVWTGRETWQTLDNIGWLPTTSQYAGRLSIGLAMLPDDDSSATLSNCAAGDYDSDYAKMGQTLTSIGRGDSFLRLGWEMNGDWYRWSIANASPSVWKSCWDHEVDALRSTDPQAEIVWNPNNQTSYDMLGKAMSYYPGDNYVDIVGVDYYDQWAPMNTQQAWDAKYNVTESDGMPEGIGAFLKFANQHGKPLAVPEWGVSNGAGGGDDDPFYIEKMHDFFAANAGDLAYEAYFDEWSQCSLSGLLGATAFPKSASEYRQLWDTDSTSSTSSSTGGTVTSNSTSGSDSTTATGSTSTTTGTMPASTAGTSTAKAGTTHLRHLLGRARRDLSSRHWRTGRLRTLRHGIWSGRSIRSHPIRRSLRQAHNKFA